MAQPQETSGGLLPTFRAAPAWLARLPGRAWRRTWRYLAGLAALLILAHLALNIYASRQLERELAKVRAQGAPLTMTEAAPPKIPDSENAAVLYMKAFEGLGLPSISPSGEPALQDRGKRADAEIVGEFVTPARRRAARHREPTFEQVEAILARHAADFRLLEEGSLRPACRFPVKWEAGFSALFPHLAGARGATRFLVAKAKVDALHGRAADALNDLAIAIRMSNHVAEEPTVITQLVRTAIIAIVCNALPEVLAAAPPDGAESRAFYDLVSRIDVVGPYVHAMEGERACHLWAYEYVRRGGFRAVMSLFWGPDHERNVVERLIASRALTPIIGVLWSPVLKLDEAYDLRGQQRSIALSRQPYRLSRPGSERLERALEHTPWYYMISPLSSAFSRAAAARDNGVAYIGLMQAALALRDYQIKHGAYPGSLAELRAAGGWAIPDDPFSGKPFVYRREGQGYIIYSIGSDFKDDGGLDRRAMYEKLRAQKRPYADAYDIPLRMTR